MFRPRFKVKDNENHKFTIGWVGRIDKKNHRKLKGYDIVLSALTDLNVSLDIRTFKENYVPREKMVEFYQGLDCFICSSESESLPNPVLEAAACGIPIISTKVGIVPELIKHHKNGLIVPRSSDDIHDAVIFLMNNPNKRAELTGHGMNVKKIGNIFLS